MDADEVEALLKEQVATGTKGISMNAKGKKGTLQNAKGNKGISRNAKKNTIPSQKRKKGKSETTGTKYNTFMKRRKVTSEDAFGTISGPLGPTLSEDELQARLRMLEALPAIPAWKTWSMLSRSCTSIWPSAFSFVMRITLGVGVYVAT